MNKEDIVEIVENLTAEQIVEAIELGLVTFDELRKTGNFAFEKQRNVKAIWKKKGDKTFSPATATATATTTATESRHAMSQQTATTAGEVHLDAKNVTIANVEHLSAEQIVEAITLGKVTFDELKKTGEFGYDKQKSVKAILKKKDDAAFAVATTVEALRNYLSAFPTGNHVSEAQTRILQVQEDEQNRERKKQERETMFKRIEEDINEFTPDEIMQEFGSDVFDEICGKLGFNKQIMHDYTEPDLHFGDVPVFMEDIPNGFTDVFFWGIPSSGKTCALSVILNTMDKQYTLTDPIIPKIFGAIYRANLVNNIFIKGQYGYLPGSTAKERTQYMPFLLKKSGEKNYRKISFFELSGEVFKYFFDKVYDTSLTKADEMQRQVEVGFNTLDLLLNSNNQKIHFFFIDYNQETRGTKDKYGLTQSDYLKAATTYFTVNNIFKEKTDAVYVVVTKADEIRESNKSAKAGEFLIEHFKGFVDALKTRCENRKYSIDFNIKIFSIGDVYFKRICKINRAYANDIIETLIKRIKPVKDSKFINILNS